MFMQMGTMADMSKGFPIIMPNQVDDPAHEEHKGQFMEESWSNERWYAHQKSVQLIYYNECYQSITITL